MMHRRLFLALAAAALIVATLAPAIAAVTTDSARRRYVATSVNLVGGTTAVIIPAMPRKWRTTRIDIHVKSVTGFVAVASISIGSNSASFNNAMAITALGTATAADAFVAQTSLVVLDSAADLTASGLQVKVTTAAVATTMTADIHVEGYFLEP